MTQSADTAAIRGIIEDLGKALHDKDAAAFVARFTPDALIYDLAPPLSHKIDADGLAAWFGTWKGPIKREVRDLSIRVSGDLAYADGYFHTSATTREDEHAEWWSRGTLCFTRSAGKWLIAHEHESVPFYMDGSFRAALDLEP